ncbi:DUF4249 domain-containing protein [Algoriphagus sediminis]|uniref:DUF4249 domain-containing protein n=1 Tax=Algoriphagus sediminis TaxID=3057113 RepID=A0ABT7YG39_9BACT|nr:DUF4249 domain-containing protein [Algoriphagus sediminis]MDN3205438.1 DUF4249 domain-containing protein [Algoriphagus sediminis]
MKHKVTIFSLLLLLILACREPFEPDIEPSDQNVLVVEGYLDSDGSPSILKLSFTSELDGPIQDNSGLLGASIFLESSSGNQFPLTEIGQGEYLHETDIPEVDTYRLRIFLRNGNSYTSEELRPIITPDIIDAGFVKNETGVEIFITTQGDENADNFLWTYEEAWAFRPAISSPFKYDPDVQDVVIRGDEERNDICYKVSPNSDLLLETSSRFEDQFVFRQSISQIEQGDEKLSVRYSILISQKALSEEDSEFWEILKKNTDDLGSIFSPLPSLIGGNISFDQDPSAPVIGQVSLGKVRQKRLFIDNREVIPWGLEEIPEYVGCFISQDTVFIESYPTKLQSGIILPVRPIIPEGGFNPIGYLTAPVNCVDCTRRGSNVPPEFWED